MQAFADVRRWAAVRAAGIARLLLHVEGHLVDAEGAVEADDPDQAAFFGRAFALEVLSVASLCAGGTLERRHVDGNFDWFEGVEPEMIERCLTMAARPVSEGTDWDGSAWLDDIRDLMHDVEARLELPEQLPRLRTGEGMFPGLAVARDWMELCAELGVPLPAVASR